MTTVRSLIRKSGTLFVLLVAASAFAKPPATTRAVKPSPGEILDLDEDRITIMLPPRETEPSVPKIYRMDESTRVFVAVLVHEQADTKGRISRTYKTERGDRDDLEVGRITQIASEGDLAKSITVWANGPAKK